MFKSFSPFAAYRQAGADYRPPENFMGSGSYNTANNSSTSDFDRSGSQVHTSTSAWGSIMSALTGQSEPSAYSAPDMSVMRARVEREREAAAGGEGRSKYIGAPAWDFGGDPIAEGDMTTGRAGFKKKMDKDEFMKPKHNIPHKYGFKEAKERKIGSGLLIPKTIEGPDFKMSKNSTDTKSGTIKTSEGTFGIEKTKEENADATALDKTTEERAAEIAKTEKRKYSAEARQRAENLHPKQKVQGMSKEAKIGLGLFNQYTGGAASRIKI